MKLKKGLSLLLSLAMLISVLPLTVSATGLVGTEKAKISLVYAEYIDGVTSDSAGQTAGKPIVEEKAVPTSYASNTHEFFLGIKLSDFANIDGASAGINNFGLGIKYDPNYIEVVDDVSGATFMFMTMLPRYGFMASTDPLISGSSGYNYTTAAMKSNKDTDDGKKEVNIILENNSNPADISGKTAYAGFIKMRLKDVAAAKASGEQLFSIVVGEDTNVSFGVSGVSGSYIYGKGTIPMEDVVEFSFPELFPTPETDASAVYKSGTFNNLSSLIVNDTLDKASILFTVTTNKGKSSDKAATGLYYGPAGKTSKDGLTELTGGVTKAMSGQHVYAIYEKDAAFAIKDLGEMTVKEKKALQSIAINGTVANTTYGTAFTLPTTSLTYNEDYTQASDANFTNAIWQIKARNAADSTYATYTPANEAKRAAGDYTLRASTRYDGVTKYSSPVDVSIGKKSITITSISGVTPVKVNGNPEVTGSANGNSITATGLVSGDSISVTYKATYNNVTAAAKNAPVSISELALATTAPSSNYTLSATTANGTGEVTETVTTLESIAIATQPTVSYTVGDTLDLSALQVTVNTKVDGTAATDTINYDASGLTYAIGGVTVAHGDAVTAAMTGQKITVTYAAYGATKTAETEVLTVAADAVNEVKIKTEPANLEYEVGATLNFSDMVVTLGYTKAADEDVNYADFASKGITVSVDGTPVTDDTKATAAMNGKTITVTCNNLSASTTATLTINAAAAEAPEARTVKVDPKTNNIVIENPSNGLQYAIVKVTDPMVEPAEDDYSTDTTFTELDRDTEYVVYTRVAASGETLASPAAASTAVKTFKNHVVILNKSNTELNSIYTDEESAADLAALNAIIEQPSRWQGYYSDAALSTELTYPLAIEEETEIYAKLRTSSGGGGGGGGWSTPATPSLSLNQKTLSGHAGDTATLRATLTNSTAKITWESDNEEVATVDENGVVTFVAVGTATITATAGSLKETAEVNVVADDVVVPTEESLINEKYTGAYVYGYEDGTFGPAREITRAEVVAMVSRLLKNPIDENRSYDTNFTDVAEDAWYKNYIGFLAQYNIVEGYGDGTFAPANKITRAEMTAILARAAKFQLTGNAVTFSDVDDSFWAKAYIATMSDKGYVKGYEDGTFAPNKNITRAETVTILNRMLDDSTVNGSIIPADVDSSYWAYNDIVKAMNDRVLR